MKLSLSWLKDYVDPKLSTAALAERLTMAGLEVEHIETKGLDTVFEIEVTPNRPDCLSVIGLAREISAITSKNLKLPKVSPYRTQKPAITITIEDKKDCSCYIGTVLSAANISTSESWITDRLSAIGLRPINNAVDVTNFVLMETGHPLHAFDLDKLEGGKILVRRAKAGEILATLDGVERKLDPSILVISDAVKPVAIAGIMGGAASAVTSSTKNILLESACFDMGLIRRASRALGLKSDSSYRFERGVPAEGVLPAANRAVDLLRQATKARYAGRIDQGGLRKVKAPGIRVSMTDIVGLLGTPVGKVQVSQGLKRLGLKVTESKAGQFKIIPPGFRQDLSQPVDVIEEVARMIGYDHLKASFPRIQVVNIAADDRPHLLKQRIAEVLTATGFSEVITYALIGEKDLNKCGWDKASALALRNALSQEHNLLRPTLLPSLLKVALTNVNRGQKDLQLFELGRRYLAVGERDTLGILATGRRGRDWRRNLKETISFPDLKGALEKIFVSLGQAIDFKPAKASGMDASCCAELFCKGKAIGVAGKIDKQVQEQWDIKAGDLFFAQVDLQVLNAISAVKAVFLPVPEFPGINRDVSIAVKMDVLYKSIQEICSKFGGEHLKDMQLIEEYTGDRIPKGQRGLVFSLSYQSTKRTLREEEVNATHQDVVRALAQELGALQR